MIPKSPPMVGVVMAISLLVSSCGGGSEPTNEGELELTVVTSGADLDADGYTASIDGGTPTVLGANQTRTLAVAAGDHSILIGGLAENCELADANPRTVTVTAGSTTTVSLSVACRATLTGRWIVSSGVAPGGAGNCTIADLTLDIIEKQNPDQPVDSLLGRYSGGEGTCPYTSFETGGVVDYPVSYTLDSMLYGVIDRQGHTDTVRFTLHFGDNPRRGTSGGYPHADSLVITLFSFVQNPSGSVVRSVGVARRP